MMQITAGFLAPATYQKARRRCARVCQQQDPIRSAPPTAPEELHASIQQSVRSAALSGVRRMRVEVTSGETDPSSPIYDEGMVITVCAKAVDSLQALMPSDCGVLIVSDLTLDLDAVNARFAEDLLSIPQSRVRVVNLDSTEKTAPTEEEEIVAIVSPRNSPGRSVTGKVREIIQSSLSQRMLVINQRLDSTIGFNSDGSEKKAGMLPIELERFELAYLWKMYQIKKKNAPAETLEDLALVLIVHRKYPESICLFKFDPLDRVASFLRDLGKSNPSFKSILSIATNYL